MLTPFEAIDAIQQWIIEHSTGKLVLTKDEDGFIHIVKVEETKTDNVVWVHNTQFDMYDTHSVLVNADGKTTESEPTNG